MNLNQLEYFISAAETLNFTKAAARCFISQTAMTQQIHALEKTVGVPLFIRDKHHVELTPAGTIFLEEAREILTRSDRALRLARTAGTGVEGAITLGFICGYGQSEMNRILRDYHRAYPGIRISLVRDNMSGLLDKMAQNKLDAIFTITPGTFAGISEMEHLYLRSFPLMAVLWAGHPLAEQDVLTYSDLRDEDFIIMQPAGRAKAEAEESMLVYSRGGYFPNVVALEGDQETLLLMISIGLGISILPEYITRPFERNPDLAMLPLVKEDGTAETKDVEVCWPGDNRNPALAQLIEMIRRG